jgi:hypothetical protein
MIAARDCKDVMDLKSKLDAIQIFDEPLNSSLLRPKLDPDEDPLDHYIKNNMFPPIDTKYCPFALKKSFPMMKIT